MGIKDVTFTPGEKCDPFEYLCRDCKQLRLAFVKTGVCNNCGSQNIITGKPGTLERSQANELEGQNEGMGRG